METNTAAQIKFAVMLREFAEISYWRFGKKYKMWKEIKAFALKHNIDFT